MASPRLPPSPPTNLQTPFVCCQHPPFSLCVGWTHTCCLWLTFIGLRTLAQQHLQLWSKSYCACNLWFRWCANRPNFLFRFFNLKPSVLTKANCLFWCFRWQWPSWRFHSYAAGKCCKWQPEYRRGLQSGSGCGLKRQQMQCIVVVVFFSPSLYKISSNFFKNNFRFLLQAPQTKYPWRNILFGTVPSAKCAFFCVAALATTCSREPMGQSHHWVLSVLKHYHGRCGDVIHLKGSRVLLLLQANKWEVKTTASLQFSDSLLMSLLSSNHAMPFQPCLSQSWFAKWRGQG